MEQSGEEEDEEGREVAEVAVRGAPPWLISAVVHFTLLILLALINFQENERGKVEVEAVYAEKLGAQLDEELLQVATAQPVEVNDAALARDVTAVEDPLAAPPDLNVVSPEAVVATSELSTPTIGLALTGREKGAKQALLAAYGGTATTESAVQAGLEWLARQQNRKTGLWSLTGPYSDGGSAENHVAATALALLAFQGAGETHQAGLHKDAVARGVEGLLKMQDADGNFFRQGVANHRLYSQALATIAMCELYGMTKDPKYRKAAQKALDYAAKIQAPPGGWRYAPRVDTDTSVTGWFMMALQSGLMAGLDVQSPTLEAVSKYLDTATPDGSRYSYQARGQPTPAMTAEALLCRQYLGWYREDPRLREGVNFLHQYPVNYAPGDLNVYYWYYATQVMHHMGGEDWKRWNRLMRQRVPEAQIKEGPERGSWSPNDDRWGLHAGRLYTTCLSVFLLEVYYRHLPIYKHGPG